MKHSRVSIVFWIQPPSAWFVGWGRFFSERMTSMSCGYACVGCGKCKGIVRPLAMPGHCPACGFDNEPDAKTCEKCGMPLPLAPGLGEPKGGQAK